MRKFFIDGKETGSCPLCTGSHYLSDNPALGPCVCLTPESIDHFQKIAFENWQDMVGARLELHGLEIQFEKLRAAVGDYLVNSLGLPANPVTIDDQYLAELHDQIDYLDTTPLARAHHIDPETWAAHFYGPFMWQVVRDLPKPWPATLANKIIDLHRAMYDEDGSTHECTMERRLKDRVRK